MVRTFGVLLAFIFSYFNSYAQFTLRNIDTIYNPEISSVKFFANGNPLSIPIIELSESSSLSLQFDDLRSGSRRLRYEIVHVDKNWKKDVLEELEYIQGFNKSQIRDFAFSTNRNQDYTFYTLSFPNKDIQLKLSGNYLVHVYEDIKKDQRDYLFTRRFLVVDTKVKINPLFVRPTDPIKYRTHHEFDFEVYIKGFPIYNSRQEIFLAVMQNGRWSTLKEDITHNREKTDYLIFDYFDKISWPAGKEFRFFDIRSLNVRTRFVKKIIENKDEIIVSLNADKLRDEFNFINERDANGNYVIDNHDLPNKDISSEYAWVDFTLLSPEFTDNKVYIIGAFSDWQCKEENLMKYDLPSSSYLGSVYLKQGYYNYAFAVMDNQGRLDTEVIEGNWYETENNYQVFVYYRPFGSRYDQLIAYDVFNTGNFKR